MTNKETLNEIFSAITYHEHQISLHNYDVSTILEPLFAEQSRMAHTVGEEPEFADLKGRHARTRHPEWELRCSANLNRTYEWSSYSSVFVQNAEYNDGETDSASLLPEFVDGTLEEKMEAVRNFYRKKLSENSEYSAARKRDEIEKSRKILEAAGWTLKPSEVG